MADQYRPPHEDDDLSDGASSSSRTPLEKLFPQREQSAASLGREATTTESTVAPDVGAPAAPDDPVERAQSEWLTRSHAPADSPTPNASPPVPELPVIEDAPEAAAPEPLTSGPLSATTQPESDRQVIELAPAAGVAPAIYEVPTPRAARADAAAGGVRVRTIRCRQCGGRASAELTLCPHCGRELHAAPTRWLTIGLPALLGILLISLIAMQGGDGPAGWVGSRIRSATNWVSELSASLDPQIAVVPAGNSSVTSLQGSGAVSASAAIPAASAVAGEETSGFEGVTDATLLGVEELLDGEEFLDAEGMALQDASSESTADVPAEANPASVTALVPEIGGVPQATATVSVSVTAPLTATGIVTSVALPTELPTELPTAAPTDTPAPATETPVPTPEPTVGPAMYTVVAGDTALAIAIRNDISLDALIAYNGWTAQQAALLQPGQQILLPPNASTLPTAVPATPTPIVVATTAATAAPVAQATLAPTQPAATVGIRVTAPRLRAPLSGVTIRCTTAGRLQWLAPADILPSDQYRVHLGFVSGRDDGGNPRITWVVEQLVDAGETQMALDSTLCGTAPDPEGNQWRWYVEVVGEVNNVTVPVSTPSDVWGFAWN